MLDCEEPFFSIRFWNKKDPWK